MILDTDSVAAEVVCDTDCGDVHTGLIEDLWIGKVFGGIGTGLELKTSGLKPGSNTRSFIVAYGSHASPQGRLTEVLL